MTELPTGAVTFLFTDIEGSTRLVKQLRERYADVLGEHQHLLREAFEAHRGHEVDTQGDSFFVAFASARDALLAALAGQRALRAHPWPEDVEIKVRMGLHTGQAIAAGDRYTGLAVHRAARIGAAGHGGQILVSQATQTLLEDEEEDLQVHLVDLGEQRLKDLDRPVRLYQAVAEGLPARFPPIRSSVPAKAEPASPRRLLQRPWIVAAMLVLGALVAGAAALAVRRDPASVTVVPNAVAVFEPDSGRLVDVVSVGGRPGPITFGAGSIWIGNLDDRTVTRIDSGDRMVQRTIALDSRTPTGLAFGFGAVWVAHGLLGQVSRIDPQFNDVSQPIDIAGTAFGSPVGSVATGLGSVWVVFGDSTLARLDRASGRVAESTRAGSLPSSIAVSNGSVWVANSGDSTVGRYAPASFTEGPLRTFTVGKRPVGIAGGNGVWVANNGSTTVTRIDPDSGAALQVAVGEGPAASAVSAEAVWVANTLSGTLSRIDPRTNEVERTIETGNAPSGLLLADGYLWVTVQAP